MTIKPIKKGTRLLMRVNRHVPAEFVGPMGLTSEAIDGNGIGPDYFKEIFTTVFTLLTKVGVKTFTVCTPSEDTKEAKILLVNKITEAFGSADASECGITLTLFDDFILKNHYSLVEVGLPAGPLQAFFYFPYELLAAVAPEDVPAYVDGTYIKERELVSWATSMDINSKGFMGEDKAEMLDTISKIETALDTTNFDEQLVFLV